MFDGFDGGQGRQAPPRLRSTPNSRDKEKARSGFPGRALIFQPVAGAVLTAARRAGLRSRQQAFTLGALASQLAGATDSFSLLTGTLFRGLFEVHVTLHFTEAAFALHLLLQGFQRLIDIVVANENLNQGYLSFGRPPRPFEGRRADEIKTLPKGRALG